MGTSAPDTTNVGARATLEQAWHTWEQQSLQRSLCQCGHPIGSERCDRYHDNGGEKSRGFKHRLLPTPQTTRAFHDALDAFAAALGVDSLELRLRLTELRREQLTICETLDAVQAVDGATFVFEPGRP